MCRSCRRPRSARVRMTVWQSQLPFLNADCAADNNDAAVEDLGSEERTHQPFMELVPQRLCFRPNGVRVANRISWSLARQPTLEDVLGRPSVDRVRCHLDLEHPIRNVFAHARLLQTSAACAALERLELTASLEHGHDTCLWIELGLDGAVLVLAGDLADPTARVMSNDHGHELGVVVAGDGEDAQSRSRTRRRERAQAAAHSRPP